MSEQSSTSTKGELSSEEKRANVVEKVAARTGMAQWAASRGESLGTPRPP